MDCWELLGIAPTSDLTDIKRAYARRLKQTRPDEDAQAYQQLREAYEWALVLAKTDAAQYEDDDAPAPSRAERTGTAEADGTSAQDPWDDADEEDEEDTPPAPLQWVQSLQQLRAESGDAALAAQWPRLQRELDAMPLAWRGETSATLAQFVIDTPDLPGGFTQQLARHFRWGEDFRDAHVMGAERAHRLRGHLERLGLVQAAELETRRRYTWHLALADWLQRGLRARAWALALLMNSRTRSLVQGAEGERLVALGVHQSLLVSRLRPVVGLAAFVQAAVVLLLTLVIALVSPQRAASPVDTLLHWMGLTVMVLGASGVNGWLASPVMTALARAVQSLHEGNRQRLAWIAAPAGIAAFFHLHVTPGTAPVLTGLAWLPYAVSLLMLWPVGRSWLNVMLPMLLLLAAGVQPLESHEVSRIGLALCCALLPSACLELVQDMEAQTRAELANAAGQIASGLFSLAMLAWVARNHLDLQPDWPLIVHLLPLVLAPLAGFLLAAAGSIRFWLLVLVMAVQLAVFQGPAKTWSADLCLWLLACTLACLVLQMLAHGLGGLLLQRWHKPQSQ